MSHTGEKGLQMPDEGEHGGLQKRLSEIYGRFREELPGNYKGISTPTLENDKHSTGNLHRYLGQVRGRAADSLHLGVDMHDLHARVGKRTQGSRRYLSQVRGRAADSMRLHVPAPMVYRWARKNYNREQKICSPM